LVVAGAGSGSAMGRQPAGAAADVEVEFIEADGTLRREPLSGCWNVAFEGVAPVRGFASFCGQRNRPGLQQVAESFQSGRRVAADRRVRRAFGPRRRGCRNQGA
jgi:hypothetical protein